MQITLPAVNVLILALSLGAAMSEHKADKIVVNKSKHELFLLKDGKVINAWLTGPTAVLRSLTRRSMRFGAW